MEMLLGAITVGILTGIVPACMGASRGKLGLGIVGFVCCAISGILMGLLLAVPVMAVFIYLIRKPSASTPMNSMNQGIPPAAPYSAAPTSTTTTTRYCSSCGGPLYLDQKSCPLCGTKA